VITNCFFGFAFEHKNSSKILKSLPKHQKSRKISKNSRIFPKNSRLIQKNSRKNSKNSRIRQLQLRWVGEIWPKKKPDNSLHHYIINIQNLVISNCHDVFAFVITICLRNCAFLPEGEKLDEVF